MPVMFDLFSGTRSASAIFEANGWTVITVDILDGQDIMTWDYKSQPKPKFIWASPPCQEYSKRTLPFKKYRSLPPVTDHSLMLKAKEIIDYWRPTYWIIENVRGARQYFNPILGQPKTCGSRYLWGVFPLFSVIRSEALQKGFGPCGYIHHGPRIKAREASRIPAAITKPLYLAITQHMEAEANDTEQ